MLLVCYNNMEYTPYTHMHMHAHTMTEVHDLWGKTGIFFSKCNIPMKSLQKDFCNLLTSTVKKSLRIETPEL